MGKRHNFPIAVLASGSGTTLEALGHSIVANNLPLELRLVIVDRLGAKALEKVTRLNKTHGWDIKAASATKEDYPKGPGERKWDLTDEQSEKMALEFSAAGIFLGVQLGLLSRTRGALFEEYGSLPNHTRKEQAALINSHPGFLWQTKGLWGPGAHKKVVDDQSEETAQTLHVVTAEYDEGTEIVVNKVAVLPTDTWKDVEAAVQAVEKQHIGPNTVGFAQAREAYLRVVQDEE